jgi:cyclopropane fatty-acyl-phospholipid synthase-like methyltransferase
LIASYVGSGFVCLDHSCGPGFLAVAAGPKAARVIGCDISGGVPACASAINPAPIIEYRKVAKSGAIPAKIGEVDLVYSFAVIQHVTVGVLQGILDEFRRVMKLGATVVCHVALDAEGRKSESVWRADKTFKGRLKWKIGLHCFTR